MITQCRLLSYIDVYFGLAALAVLALISLAVAQIIPSSAAPVFTRGKGLPKATPDKFIKGIKKKTLASLF